MNITKASVNLLLVMLLLFSSTGFSFPEPTERTAAFEQSFIHVADLQQSTHASAEVLRSSWRIFAPEGNTLFRVRDLDLFSSGKLSGNEYIRYSEAIVPGLDIPDIIYPFHVFL